MKDLLEAITIFCKYEPDNRTPLHCEHDYLYVDVHPDKVTREDKTRLDELGFFVDSEYGGDGFGSFRFGSC